MPYPTETPYQILDISPSASSEEVKKARDRALKRRQQQPQKIMQAFSDLRNPKTRIETDLLVMTDVGNEKDLEYFLSALSHDGFLPKDVPVLASHPALLALGQLQPEGDFLDIPANPYQPDLYRPEADPAGLLVNLSLPE